MDPDNTGSLEEQVAELRARVRLLERTIRAYGLCRKTRMPRQPILPRVRLLPQLPAIEATPPLPQMAPAAPRFGPAQKITGPWKAGSARSGSIELAFSRG